MIHMKYYYCNLFHEVLEVTLENEDMLQKTVGLFRYYSFFQDISLFQLLLPPNPQNATPHW